MKQRLLRLAFVGAIAMGLGAASSVAVSALRGEQPVQRTMYGNNTASPWLPPTFDADGDGFYNQLESALGSDPNDKGSTPESHALADADQNGVADVCEDFADNDRDGLTDEDDPGCTLDPLTADLEPGVDIFGSSATIEAGSLGNRFPPEALKLQGPVVIKRGEPDRGALLVEMVAMQLTGDSSLGPVTLIENPDLASPGRVASETGAPPWSSFFDLNTLTLFGERVISETVRVENPSIDHLPPVQDARKIDPSKCYQFPGGLHCPAVPRLKLPVLKWVAKFDCGQQPATPPPFLGPVQPGNYATKIVIHNPQGVPVHFKKKVAVGMRNPEYGPISRFHPVTLPPDAVTEVDCADILKLLGQDLPPLGKQLPFMNGVVVILSQKKLDVIANYTQEVPKEKLDFIIRPPANAPPALQALARSRLKLATLVDQEVIINEELEIRTALKQQFPPAVVDRTTILILGDSLGVGSSIDVEEIRPQKCLLIDPPALPDGQLTCEVGGL